MEFDEIHLTYKNEYQKNNEINVDEDHRREEYRGMKENRMLRYKEQMLTNFLSNRLEYA
jgi:hypothetical protein